MAVAGLVATFPEDQETHIFTFPASVGTRIVNPDASGSFQFSGLKQAAMHEPHETYCLFLN
jgi:hypothetical protein